MESNVKTGKTKESVRDFLGLFALALVLATLLAVILIPNPARADSEGERARARLDELFKWKVSDTLQLDAKQEQKFAVVLKEVTDRRRKCSEKMEEISQALQKPENKSSLDRLLKEYQAQVKSYGDTQSYELEQLKKVFGVERLAKYIVLKSDLSSKLKNVISGKEPSSAPPGRDAKKLPEPKIIEESVKE